MPTIRRFGPRESVQTYGVVDADPGVAHPSLLSSDDREKDQPHCYRHRGWDLAVFK